MKVCHYSTIIEEHKNDKIFHIGQIYYSAQQNIEPYRQTRKCLDLDIFHV